MFWIGIGTQVALGTGDLTYPTKPINVSGCDATTTTTDDLLSTTTAISDVDYLSEYEKYRVMCGITFDTSIYNSTSFCHLNIHERIFYVNVDP